MPASKKETTTCPIDAALTVIDGRWKGTILWRLSERPMRTSELRRSIPGITERMLIRHLQDLVRDGILIRHQEAGRPPRVHYTISAYGQTLLPVLRVVCAWGRRHLQSHPPQTFPPLAPVSSPHSGGKPVHNPENKHPQLMK